MSKIDKKQQEEVIKKLKEYEKMHGHAPVSRREFLGAGLISFAGSFMLPSALTLLGNSAHAAQCVTNSGNQMISLITLNLSGGAMLASDFVPMDQGGQMLSSYSKMGLGKSPAIERAFGNVPFAANGISNLLEGIKATANPSTMDKTAFVGIPVRLRDDTHMNELDISGMVARAGLMGAALPNLGRDSQVGTGIKQSAAYITPPNPLIVRSSNDIINSIGANNGLLQALNEEQRGGLFALIHKLSNRQKQRVISSTGGEVFSNLLECANLKNIEQANVSGGDLDVRNSEAFRALWGVTASTSSSDAKVLAGTMALASLRSYSGSAAIQLGGYDYHNNTRGTGNAKDREAGEYIGRILETAALENKKLMLYVTTDGSCSSPDSDSATAPWRGDRGSAGMVYMLMFDPNGRPKTKNFQLGQFTNAQAADDNFITGRSASFAAAAVFANYLEWQGKLNLLEQLIPNRFSPADLNQMLVLG